MTIKLSHIKHLFVLICMMVFMPTKGQINTERMMNIGRNALYYDDYVLAIQYFNMVIAAKPHLYEPYFYRGLAKFYLDDYSGATQDCTEAIERNPYYPNSYEVRGLSFINMNDYESAESDYEAVCRIENDNRSAWHNLVLCNMELNRLEQADSIANIFINKWKTYADGYNLKAQVQMQMKDTVAAEKSIDKALEVDKYNVSSISVKAGLLMQREEYKSAISYYTEALRLQPKSAGNLINRAMCHYHMDHYREAMKDYDLALDLEPANFVGHYNRGLLRANVGEDNLAIEDFNFILSIDPDDMMATFNRATLLENVGDYRGAIRDYTTVIKEFPKFTYGYERRATARRKIGDIAGANRDEEHVLKEQIAHRYGYSTPTSRQKNKTRKKSEFNLEDYQKLVEEDSKEADKEYESEYRGKIQNRDQEAILIQPNARTLYIYKEYAPDDALEHFDAGYNLAKDGKINEAIEEFSKTIETNGTIAEAYFNRGLLKLLIDERSSGIQDLSKAGELGIYSAYNIIKKNQKRK